MQSHHYPNLTQLSHSLAATCCININSLLMWQTGYSVLLATSVYSGQIHLYQTRNGQGTCPRLQILLLFDFAFIELSREKRQQTEKRI